MYASAGLWRRRQWFELAAHRFDGAPVVLLGPGQRLLDVESAETTVPVFACVVASGSSTRYERGERVRDGIARGEFVSEHRGVRRPCRRLASS
jgi:hypothetical protein